MNDEPKPCCPDCRGSAPYHFCTNKYVNYRQPGCQCHQKQDRLSRLKEAQLYRDPTAEKAIGIATKGRQ